jgi:hypothetical protein
VLRSRAHRVPAERDGDFAVLWDCFSPDSLEEHETFYEEPAKEGAVGLGR